MKLCNKYKKPALFLIENNPMLLIQLNSEMAANNGYDVYSYFSTEQALKELEAIEPKIVIVSSNPERGLNEQQAVIAIKSILPETYVVILSTNDAEGAIDLLKSGADNFIQKTATSIEELAKQLLSLPLITNLKAA